jgi:hypothetical protein
MTGVFEPCLPQLRGVPPLSPNDDGTPVFWRAETRGRIQP